MTKFEHHPSIPGNAVYAPKYFNLPESRLEGTSAQARLPATGIGEDPSRTSGPNRESEHEKAVEPKHKSIDLDMGM